MTSRAALRLKIEKRHYDREFRSNSAKKTVQIETILRHNKNNCMAGHAKTCIGGLPHTDQEQNHLNHKHNPNAEEPIFCNNETIRTNHTPETSPFQNYSRIKNAIKLPQSRSSILEPCWLQLPGHLSPRKHIYPLQTHTGDNSPVRPPHRHHH